MLVVIAKLNIPNYFEIQVKFSELFIKLNENRK